MIVLESSGKLLTRPIGDAETMFCRNSDIGGCEKNDAGFTSKQDST